MKKYYFKTYDAILLVLKYLLINLKIFASRIIVKNRNIISFF